MAITTIEHPPYVYREVENDLPPSKNLAVRVANAALPFLSLYKPWSYPFSLAMGGARLATTCKKVWEGALNNQMAYNFFHAAVAATSLAGTYFRHPLGMLIGSLHDLITHSSTMKGTEGVLQALNTTLYIALFFHGGAGLTAASFSLQFASEIFRAQAHFEEDEETLEAFSHLMMAFVRGHQAIRQCQSIYIEREIEKAKETGKPYLPLANRAQKFFVNVGYRVNRLARWTVGQIGAFLLSPPPELSSKICTGAKIACAVPFTLASFLISTPCYLAASYLGVGRFERIEAETCLDLPLPAEVRGMFQNICGQDPWSRFTGGVLPPLEEDAAGKRRVDSFIEEILEERPHVYCGQEFDDLDTSQIIGQALAKEGYTCVRDLGCNDPFLNHSGLFMATQNAAVIDSASFHPFAEEDTSGLTSWCNRGILEASVPLQNEKTLRLINLHLNSGGAQDQAARLAQLRNYVTPLLHGQAAIAMGDSNLDTSALTPEEREQANLGNLVNHLAGQVTCTDEGKHQLNGKPRQECADCAEQIDVLLYDPAKVTISSSTIVPGNSDHHRISWTASHS